MRPSDPTDRVLEPNDKPSREEYTSLHVVLDRAVDLLDAMAGRDMIAVREEYRDLSNAVAKARVEIRKQASRERADAEFVGDGAGARAAE